MEHDVKEGWCICGEYHKRVDSKKAPEKVSPKKASAPKVRVKKDPKPKPKPNLEAIAEEMLPLDDGDDEMKYPFGAPRIF